MSNGKGGVVAAGGGLRRRLGAQTRQEEATASRSRLLRGRIIPEAEEGFNGGKPARLCQLDVT